MHDSILFTALWNLLCTAFCVEGDYRSADSVLYNSVLHDISGDRRIYHAASGILHRADHTVPFPGKYSRSVETCASLYNRCLINDILKREVQITEKRLLLERVKNETGMYRTISENYDKQKKREHEYKNQLALIAALASENRVDEISHYLKQYNLEIMQHTDFIDTNNVIVNAILNSKYQETREKGIVFVVKVNDLSNLKIRDEDIVLILSNLLNNAIEACEQCEKPIIKMKFVKEEHQIILSVANTFSGNPVIVGKRYITTKTKEADRHGIGLENIKETVGKYDGSCVIKHDENNFKVAILIHNQEK